MAVETSGQREGIRGFYDECHSVGLSAEATYRFYISGLGAKGSPVDIKDHLSRGGSISRLTEDWLHVWRPKP